MEHERFSKHDPHRRTGRVHWCLYWQLEYRSDMKSSPKFNYGVDLSNWMILNLKEN